MTNVKDFYSAKITWLPFEVSTLLFQETPIELVDFTDNMTNNDLLRHGNWTLPENPEHSYKCCWILTAFNICIDVPVLSSSPAPITTASLLVLLLIPAHPHNIPGKQSIIFSCFVRTTSSRHRETKSPFSLTKQDRYFQNIYIYIHIYIFSKTTIPPLTLWREKYLIMSCSSPEARNPPFSIYNSRLNCLCPAALVGNTESSLSEFSGA